MYTLCRGSQRPEAVEPLELNLYLGAGNLCFLKEHLVLLNTEPSIPSVSFVFEMGSRSIVQAGLNLEEVLLLLLLKYSVI